VPRGPHEYPVSKGSPEPLGASLTDRGVNFAVYSARASCVEVCLYGGDGDVEIARLVLPGRTGPVFHGHVDGLKQGARYGLRAHGAFDPDAGLWFNPAKLLVDPYALALDRKFILHPSMFARADAVDLDSGAVMPKAVVVSPAPAVPTPPRACTDTVVYEAHVRGFTRRLDAVPEPLRGTFAGLAHPAAIDHLRRLGVSSLEILPAAAWIDERHLPPLGLTNYWGYNPVAFMVPDPKLAPGGWDEVRAAVATLADAGIETIVDVVFNHTGEGDELGPVLSLRGLDNAAYYRLKAGEPGRYVDDTGTGATLALDSPPALRLVMDALRAWRRFGGVAGFRFDLATVLGRRAAGYDPAAPLMLAIDQDPELRGLKLIAEPWDIGPGGYQLGTFPPAWGEWNDRFRDTARGFWRGDGASLGELARRLSGSQDVFAGRSPSRSVNFITAHDGFTLADLVAYADKHNEANGENNRDGANDNRSWNHGVEGPTDNQAILAARLADQRALLATLLLSRGTPMLSMGAELGQSQGGSNNAYAQDNAVSWLDWSRADPSLTAFTARLMAVRRDHPAVSADRFLNGEGLDPDVQWRAADGRSLQPSDWEDPFGTTLVMALALGDDRVVVALHRGAGAIEIIPPAADQGCLWTVLADTGDPERQGPVAGQAVAMAARSVLVLSQIDAPGRGPRGVSSRTLAALADAAGIESAWWTHEGEARSVTPDTQVALLKAMGLPCDTQGQAREALAELAEIAAQAPPAPPSGVCHIPKVLADGGRVFGLSTQLYSLRRDGDQGVGDFTTLTRLVEEAAKVGAAAVGLNPLHALFPERRDRASPYYPSDRRFLDPIYLDLARIPYAEGPGFAEVVGSELIDYPGVWARKAALLQASFAKGRSDPSFCAYERAAGESLRRFATFEAISEARPGAPWTQWPDSLRDPATARANPERVSYHIYLQWLCEAQLADAARATQGLAVGLIGDLAVGAAPDGAEVWSNASLMAKGVSIGAPPDPLGPLGQVWGLPPMIPHRLIADRFAINAELFRSNMRHVRGLRVDHALGLKRQFWIPDGADAADGAYVRFPFEDLLAVLARESRAARCLVIGEDLGTVPEGFREALAGVRAFTYRVAPFERDGGRFRAPELYPRLALACVATHDLPPLAGWWDGVDIDERFALDMLSSAAAADERSDRNRAKQALVEALIEANLTPPAHAIDQPLTPSLAGAIHAFIAITPCALDMIQVEDLLGERTPINLPGTDRERPNWRRRLSAPVESVGRGEMAGSILGAVAARRSP